MAWRHDLPQVRPEFSPRSLSAAEVVRLVQGDPVSGVDEQSHVIQTLRRGLPGNYARLAFAEARRQGYLFVNHALYADRAVATQLREVWGWWCAAAGHPEVVLMWSVQAGTARVHCDVSTTGNDWSFAAFAAIGKLVEPLAPYAGGSWLFTMDELQIDGIEMDDAVHLARSLVDLGTMGRFREGVYDEGSVPEPGKTRFPGPMSPMERTAG